LLQQRHIPFAVVGATAMAVHGVSRATHDFDILTLDRACLEPTTWTALERTGVTVLMRAGDADDPLAGVVRLSAGDASPVDVVVGRGAWQRAIVDRAVTHTIEGVVVPVATPVDLILLKLYAAGPQDAWDVEQLLAAGDREALIAQVQTTLSALPEDSRRLWARIVRPR
jgi:hypothetical protein